MNNRPFIINNRFWVHPDLGLIKQKDSGEETHLEPRIMHLLCALVMHNHELLGRGFLKHHVWNDYGNADEALNQGISYLRKVLEDDEKTLIETIPKKGYILRTVIKFEIDKPKDTDQTGTGKQKTYWIIAAIVLALITSGYFIYRANQPLPNAGSPDVIQNNLKDSTKSTDGGATEKKAGADNADKLPDTTHKGPPSTDAKK